MRSICLLFLSPPLDRQSCKHVCSIPGRKFFWLAPKTLRSLDARISRVAEVSIGALTMKRNQRIYLGALSISFIVGLVGIFLPVSGALADEAGGAQSTASASAADAGAKVEALTNEGVEEMGKSNLPAAIEKFKEALTIDPACGVARRNLSAALSNQGTRVEPEEGVSYWRKALFVWPENKPAHNNLSTFLQSIGKVPDSFDERVSLANSFVKTGDYVSAVVELREAIALKKDAVVEAKLKEYLKKAPALPN
jgi:tetratricopeptide (TPR) repeat protein